MFTPVKLSNRQPFFESLDLDCYLYNRPHEVLRMNREDLVINQGGWVGFVVG
jgi:hypothetical protein